MTAQLRRHRGKLVIVVGVVAIVTAGAASWVLMGSDDGNEIQAIRQGNQIQFRIPNDAIETMRTEIFNLGGKRLYDSGPTTGNSLQWPMTTETGERVARGVYLYVIQAWGPDGELVKSRTGKVAVTPDGVGLEQAPLSDPSGNDTDSPDKSNQSTGDSVESAAVDQDHSGESWAFGQVGVGTTNIDVPLRVNGLVKAQVDGHAGLVAFREGGKAMAIQSGLNGARLMFENSGPLELMARDRTDVLSAGGSISATKVRVMPNGQVGIGNDVTPQAQLEVQGNSSNLLKLVSASSSSSVFRVEDSGDTFADGSFNCGLSSGCFNAGQGADVAERVQASERVEAGDVIAIDPGQPDQFRKTRDARSSRVAGVVSTRPGVTLGNSFDGDTERWSDGRPLLALAGRVPVKVTSENGPIQAGDSLTSSSTPGHAMRCADASQCVGSTIGKALESLGTDSGVILAQVSLR